VAVMVAVLAVTITAAAAEGAPATARLAGWLTCWAASRRYASNPGRAARRAEEWQALTCRRPGGRVLGLLTAAGFALAAVRARRLTGAPALPPAGIAGEGNAILPVPAGSSHAAGVPVSADSDAARAIAAIYTAHHGSLVRLAVRLIGDVAAAEEVVQDSFTAVHTVWRLFPYTEDALSYLRESVVNRSHLVLRERALMEKNTPGPSSAG
jgi:hypothetical protein